MENGNINVINWGMELHDEIGSGNNSILATNNAFMCSCQFDGGCTGGVGISITIPF